MNTLGQRLERNIGVIVLTLLLLGCLIVMQPFVTAVLWSVVLCFSTWPVYTRLLRIVRGRRTLAALLMLLAMIVVILLPFLLIGATLASNVQELAVATKKWIAAGPPAPPDWLVDLPVVGQQAADYWRGLAADSEKLLALAERLVEPISTHLLKAGLVLGGGLLHLAGSIFIAFFFFRDGLALAGRLTNGVERIGGERGKHLLGVAGDTVRGVVYGILGTALVQALVAGVGFFIAGVPGYGLLALLTFFLSVVPVGPPMVWIPAALWLYHQDSLGWAVFMAVWGLGVSSIDNVVKPWIISQGSRLPFVLIFFGVVGGAVAFGLIGVFLGPTLLAVGFRLVEEWASVRRTQAAPEQSSAAAADKPPG
ncbi:MAG: AI-2E family transporter [Acidobacteriota bacterium]